MSIRRTSAGPPSWAHRLAHRDAAGNAALAQPRTPTETPNQRARDPPRGARVASAWRMQTARAKETVTRDATALRDWLARARVLVPRKDRAVLFSPPRLVARFTRFALARHAGRAAQEHADDLTARDPELVSLVLDFWHAVGARYFRFHAEGVEHVPVTGPVLLVGNHNGGLLPTDGFFTALALRDRFGAERAMYTLAHDFLFEDPTLRSYAQRLGLLRAGADGAHRALAAGHCVLVYPGSDYDAFRAFRERRRVVLGGRHGFLRLALRERVPIVPVVSVGTHEQLIVLTRGDRIARLLHMHAWARTEVFPLVLALPWGLTSGFVPYLPLPAQTTVAFGEPLTWPDLSPFEADHPDVLDACYARVHARMQAMLDRLHEGRRFLMGPPPSSAAAETSP